MKNELRHLLSGSADQHRKNVSAKQLLLSTAELPTSQQFAFWSDALLNPTFGVHSDPLKPIDKDFRGEVEAWITPCLAYYRYSSDDVLVSRGLREITHRRMDSFCLYREHASGLGLQNKRNSGDFIIGDIDGVFAYQAHRECWLDIWLLPKAPIAAHLPAQGRPFAARLKRDHGISPLLAAFVNSLTAQMSELSPGQLEALVEPLSRLVAIAFGSPQGEHREAVRVAFVQRAKQYIARALSP